MWQKERDLTVPPEDWLPSNRKLDKKEYISYKDKEGNIHFKEKRRRTNE